MGHGLIPLGYKVISQFHCINWVESGHIYFSVSGTAVILGEDVCSGNESQTFRIFRQVWGYAKKE